MGFVRGFGQFWYDFIIGDDWKIAAAVVATLAIGAVILLADLIPVAAFTPVLGVAIAVAFVVSMVIDVRR